MDSHSSVEDNSADSQSDGFPFKAALRQQLLDSIETRNRRQRFAHRGLIAAAWIAVIAIVGTVGLVATDSKDATAATIQVTNDGSYTVVNLIDFDAPAADVQSDLKDKGILSRVESVPVGPTAVGHFVGSGLSNSDNVEFIISPDGTSTSFRIKDASKTVLTLELGRKAKAEEDWNGGIDAFLDGYLLHCSKLWHASPRAVQTYAQQHGFQVSFNAPTEPNLVANGDLNGIVTEASQFANNKVNILLTSNGVSPYVDAKTSAGATDCL